MLKNSINNAGIGITWERYITSKIFLIGLITFVIALCNNVMAQPTANFTVAPSSGCTPLTVTFTDISGVTDPNYIWIYNFGDGTIDTVYGNGNTIHTYTYETNFSAQLRVEDTTTSEFDLMIRAVNVFDKPTIDFEFVDGQVPYCVGDTIWLRYTPADIDLDSLIWDFGDGTKVKTDTLNPIAYVYMSRDTFDIEAMVYRGTCGDTATHSIVVNGPIADFSFDVYEGCLGDSVVFTIDPGSIDVDTYGWRPEGISGSLINSPSPYSHTYTSSGLFEPILEATGAGGTCVLTDTTIRIYGTQARIGYKSSSGAGYIEFCDQRNVFFEDDSEDHDMFNTWDMGDGTLYDSIKEPTHKYDAGEYIVKLFVQNGFGCHDSVADTLFINELPEIQIGPDTTICPEDSTQLWASGGHVIDWRTNSGINDYNSYTPMVSPGITTEYKPVVTDTITHCSSVQGVAIQTVNVFAIPHIDFEANLWRRQAVIDSVYVIMDTLIIVSDTVVVGDTVQVKLVSHPNEIFNYLWTPNQYISCVECANPTIRPLTIGENSYTLEISDIYKCAVNDTTINLLVLEAYTFGVPKAFTPNGDNVNDEIKVDGWGVKTLLEFSIYNRWGNKVFFTDNINEGWDGALDGKDQPVDTYSYYIKVELWDDRVEEKRGSFTLIR